MGNYRRNVRGKISRFLAALSKCTLTRRMHWLAMDGISAKGFAPTQPGVFFMSELHHECGLAAIYHLPDRSQQSAVSGRRARTKFPG